MLLGAVMPFTAFAPPFVVDQPVGALLPFVAPETEDVSAASEPPETA